MYIFQLDIFWFNVAPTYYGLMYAIWFIVWYQILLYKKVLSREKLDDLFLYIFLWVIIWWRLWYILFYNLSYYLNNMLDIFKIWEWWMSFHWWLIWVIIAIFLFSKRNWESFFKISDQISLVVPIWLLAGRFWNYLNDELLWFSPYNWFLSIHKDWITYFPSSLVESFLEWFLLLVILNYIYSKKNKIWIISALFLILYWFFRFIIEFLRIPDIQIWYLAFWWLTMWQILSSIMVVIWIFIFINSKNKKC